MTVKVENWKDVPDYEGYYSISDKGNIKSVSRKVKAKNGRILNIKEKLLKPNKDAKGYFRVTLSKFSKHKTYTVHQLVAMAFLNHIPNGHTMVVDHIDFNPSNNNLSNIRVVSHRKNTNHRKDTKTSVHPGVGWYAQYGKWRSRIQLNGSTIHLGYFDKESDAAKAYKDKINEWFEQKIRQYDGQS